MQTQARLTKQTYTTEEIKVQGLAQPALPSRSLHLNSYRHSFCSTLILRRWLWPECHMMNIKSLSHLISLHQAKALPRMPRLGVACSRCSLSIEKLNEAGGVTSNHAISTSSPCETGHDGPCLRLAVTLAPSRSCPSPVPAMHRRHFAAVMWLAGSDSCGVGSQKQMPASSERDNPRGQRHPRACSSRRATRSEEGVSNAQSKPFLVA